MRLPDLEAWAIFACVVEHRSFSAAADAIGVSKATVSKAISRLEAHLGASLFHRTSRKLTLTESGKALAEHAQRILAEAQAAEEAASTNATAPTGLVRIAAPMTFGISHVAPAIADFMIEHPGIHIDLRLSDARIDIVAEGFDVAMRIASLPDSSLRARRIAPIETRVVASPLYLDRRGRPRHASANPITAPRINHGRRAARGASASCGCGSRAGGASCAGTAMRPVASAKATPEASTTVTAPPSSSGTAWRKASSSGRGARSPRYPSVAGGNRFPSSACP